MTIADGGPNDVDNITGQVTDPGGIGVGSAEGVPFAGQSLNSATGCTIQNQPARGDAVNRGDFWLLLAFFGLLWRLRKNRVAAD